MVALYVRIDNLSWRRIGIRLEIDLMLKIDLMLNVQRLAVGLDHDASYVHNVYSEAHHRR